VQDLPFTNPRHLSCFVPWNTAFSVLYVYYGPNCYPRVPYKGNANMYVHDVKTLGEALDDTETSDYEVPAYAYYVPDDRTAESLGCSASAHDNYRDGTQSFVYVLMTPVCNPGDSTYVYGFSEFLIHEYGHHLGLSHVRDGFDYENETDFDASGPLYFARVGDESNTVMSYMNVNNDFSQFDRDNMNRWLTAAYITSTNKIADDVLASKRADQGRDELAAADDQIGRAAASIGTHDYRRAVSAARRAYLFAVEAAREAGVKIVGDRRGTTLLESGGPYGLGIGPYRYAFVDPLDQMLPGANR
jgi:hypothetical protein